MKEKELNFDRKKHVCYSKQVKNVILDRLQQKYDEKTVNSLFEKMQQQYILFLKDLPYLGGKKCTHNGAGGTYDCIMLFAYYEVLTDKPTVSELYEMNNELLLPPYKRLGKIANINNVVLQRIMNKIFEIVQNKDKKIEDKSDYSYIMRVDKYDKDEGIRYKFYRCPIAEFAKSHGYTHLMPAMCNGDYPALEQIHATLIREHTCSNYEFCDYKIVGDKSDVACKSARKISKEGYFYNPNPTENNKIENKN